MKTKARNRYSSIPKRNFHNAIIRLLEEQFKVLGSHKVLQLIADEIVNLHKEFYPEIEKQSFGHIVWRTTSSNSKKPGYGTKAEDYESKTVILPLVNEDDIENRICNYYGKNENYKKQTERDIERMARLIKSAYEQGGILSGAELSVLLNRSLTTITRYIRQYHQKHSDILPTKGIILDQGSKPTHKASIINLYEQGYPEADIARFTNHTIESTSRYIKAYKNIKLLLQKGFEIMEMVRITGMGRSTVIQYCDLLYQHYPRLKQKEEENINVEEKNKGR